MFQSSWGDFADFERIFVRIKNTISGFYGWKFTLFHPENQYVVQFVSLQYINIQYNLEIATLTYFDDFYFFGQSMWWSTGKKTLCLDISF